MEEQNGQDEGTSPSRGGSRSQLVQTGRRTSHVESSQFKSALVKELEQAVGPVGAGARRRRRLSCELEHQVSIYTKHGESAGLSSALEAAGFECSVDSISNTQLTAIQQSYLSRRRNQAGLQRARSRHEVSRRVQVQQDEQVFWSSMHRGAHQGVLAKAAAQGNLEAEQLFWEEIYEGANASEDIIHVRRLASTVPVGQGALRRQRPMELKGNRRPDTTPPVPQRHSTYWVRNEAWQRSPYGASHQSWRDGRQHYSTFMRSEAEDTIQAIRDINTQQQQQEAKVAHHKLLREIPHHPKVMAKNLPPLEGRVDPLWNIQVDEPRRHLVNSVEQSGGARPVPIPVWASEPGSSTMPPPQHLPARRGATPPLPAITGPGLESPVRQYCRPTPSKKCIKEFSILSRPTMSKLHG